jgi:hypothetical protein
MYSANGSSLMEMSPVVAKAEPFHDGTRARVGCFGEGDDLVGTQLVERDGQAGMSDLGGVARTHRRRGAALTRSPDAVDHQHRPGTGRLDRSVHRSIPRTTGDGRVLVERQQIAGVPRADRL